MHDDLLTLLKRRYGDDPQGVERHHYQFAVSNRERARKLINRIKERSAFQFRGSRILDVGCAYAGFAIATAALGAEAWGVELDSQFFAYGEANARGEAGEVRLIHGDFLAESTMRALPRGFDLVLVNDVFEHVYDTTRLLKHVAAVLAPGGLLVFMIPNGNALDFIEREGHNLKLGVSLLPPAQWRDVVKWFSTYYRPWGYFVALLHAFGFDRIDTWNESPVQPAQKLAAEILEKLSHLGRLIDSSDYGPAVKRSMSGALGELAERVAADAALDNADLLHWKYVVRFWEGCASLSGRAEPGVAAFV